MEPRDNFGAAGDEENKSHPVPLLLPSGRARSQQAGKTLAWGRGVNLGYLSTLAFTAGTLRWGSNLPNLLLSP